MLKRTVQLVELRLIVDVELFGESTQVTKELYAKLKQKLETDLVGNSTVFEKAIGQFENFEIRDALLFRNLEEYHRFYRTIQLRRTGK